MSTRRLSHSTEKGLPEATGTQSPPGTQGTGGRGDATKPHFPAQGISVPVQTTHWIISITHFCSFTKVPGKRADGGDTATAPSHHGRVARGGPGGQAGTVLTQAEELPIEEVSVKCGWCLSQLGTKGWGSGSLRSKNVQEVTAADMKNCS